MGAENSETISKDVLYNYVYPFIDTMKSKKEESTSSSPLLWDHPSNDNHSVCISLPPVTKPIVIDARQHVRKTILFTTEEAALKCINENRTKSILLKSKDYPGMFEVIFLK